MRNNSYNQRTTNKSYTRKPDVEYEVVEDYGSIIRKAREEKNLTQKKLGEKIYERESVISHIESGKMIPEIKIARKLEKLLNIKIVEKVESDVQEFKDIGRYREATIGDIARIKRK
jgi:putative transcription factor